jgi:predicted DCC family thiol-disulfide oxidoreductase YuxK
MKINKLNIIAKIAKKIKPCPYCDTKVAYIICEGRERIVEIAPMNYEKGTLYTIHTCDVEERE